MPKYLLDASALYLIILEPYKYTSILEDSAILDLTLYEIGNAALVSWRRKLLRSYTGFMKSVTKAARILEIIRLGPEDIEGIARVAEKTRLTYYDSAYVYVARKLGLVLVTEDTEILRKARDVAKPLKGARRVAL